MTPFSDLLSFEQPFAGRRVLVTGHTGFKGGWLAQWLVGVGAEVHGIALAPDTEPNLFDVLELGGVVNHHIVDIRNRDLLIQRVRAVRPEIIFHLAAQPLVRRSYDHPLTTFETNVMGTAYVLEAARQAPETRAIVCVTTDKVYENQEERRPYLEFDRLGGKDPYSASKAAAELVAASYRHSYRSGSAFPALATARGGNVIGGGDWSQDRLVPDLVRAIAGGHDLIIRNPDAVRPWQHVLGLCHGYLLLATQLLESPSSFEGAWNFGPEESDTISVQILLEHFRDGWKIPRVVVQPALGKPESRLLSLDSGKAKQQLNWRTPWPLSEAVRRTAEWYAYYYESPADARALTSTQIRDYRAELTRANAKSG